VGHKLRGQRVARYDNLHRWAQEYARQLSQRDLELDRYVEPSLTVRGQRAQNETPQWFGITPQGLSAERIPASHLLRKGAPKCSLLLGPPACGKSATCRFLARVLLERFLAGQETRFPVLLPGNRMFSAGRTIWDSIHDSLDVLKPNYEFEMIIRAAGEGKVVLLVDGYNESPREMYGWNAHLVEQWAYENPSSFCIVTSRLRDAPVLKNFHEYEFAPFTREQIRHFVRLRLPDKEAQKFLAMLEQMGPQSVVLSSPYLLSQFIEEYFRTGVPPDPTSFTFADLVNRLFSQRADPEKRIAITALLAHLAKRMTDERTRAAPRQLIRDIAQSDPELFSRWNNNLDSLMTALFSTDCLVEESGDRIAFVHIGLLEHFAKSYLGPIDQIWTPSIVIPKKTIEAVRFVDEELVKRLAKEPRDLYRLSSREFEKLIAELFRDRGWSVELTKQTRDGGSDIIAVRDDVGSHFKMLIEAKRYSPDRPVGVGMVRELYAVRQLRHASKAMLATTSYFSPDAYREFDSVMPWELELSDYDQILDWLKAYGGK